MKNNDIFQNKKISSKSSRVCYTKLFNDWPIKMQVILISASTLNLL